MIAQLWIRVAELALIILLAAAVILAWREARSDRAQLQSQLAAASQALAAATSRQQDRDTKLSDVLTSIAAEKKAASSPDQLLAGIAREVGLTTPLTMQPATASAGGPSSNPPITTGAGNSPSSTPLPRAVAAANPQGGQSPVDSIPNLSGQLAPDPQPSGSAGPQLPSAPAAQIPAADLKPLYNYILDCKACQAKLAAAQDNLADEKLKTSVLTTSRDQALQAAKGGSLWKRTTRALKWFAIGAAAGAIAAKSVR
jgi:hypothetical protein